MCPEIDSLYCSVVKQEREISVLRWYLRDFGWVVVHNEIAKGDTSLTHLVKGSASMVFYRGQDWVHLSVTDSAGTDTIDKLLKDNPSLGPEQAERCERRKYSV